ncbi:MAG TPA: bifunctional DNA-formamidopyrimidine glycosylase/DNA-(apurinic or apyrimidinic site) lyase [Xanthomonadales bacterium]|nr:bifunctional DNA-formamidopyrimidine glycosylase/DNA-(apurinic or apyrimidinic site) lyase [Xanthomonadales bacterium]
MPELPEVETTLRGIEPALRNQRIADIVVHNPALRIPVDDSIRNACGRVISGLHRRSKYLVIETPADRDDTDAPVGGLLIHLGMSGSLRICHPDSEPRLHDHVELVLESGTCLRFNDPRRFGLFTWWDAPIEEHRLIRNLGPEPLTDDFSANHLYKQSRGRSVAVKNFIMNGNIVVGVGNIYASEALFRAGIHPSRAAGRISLKRYQELTLSIRDVLEQAIRQGGTTLRDFSAPDSQPGYFAQDLQVYERADNPCFMCSKPIRRKVIGQRSTYYCAQCQR